jgi:exodeoxyribonuclease VII small subunit
VSEPSNQSGTGGETTTDEATSGEDDLTGLSYETARARLIKVVTQLESGGVPLDESLALWERGERLAEICQRWLDGAQAKIDAARVDRTLENNLDSTEPAVDTTDAGADEPRR